MSILKTLRFVASSVCSTTVTLVAGIEWSDAEIIQRHDWLMKRHSAACLPWLEAILFSFRLSRDICSRAYGVCYEHYS